jgi:tetratricopeptide (TPR) repeat protein
MKTRFLSREFAAWRVVKALLAMGVCLLGLVAVLAAGVRVAHPWYCSWRSTQVLCGLNERTQTLDEQLQIAGKALRLNPRNWHARYWYAHKLGEQKKYKVAAENWAQFRRWSPPGGVTDTAFADQGMCLLFAHQPAEAIIYLEETIRRRPDHVSARGFLATAYADLGLHDRVREELVKLANLKPGWRQQFDTCPEWPEEHKACLAKLESYLKEMKKEISPWE